MTIHVQYINIYILTYNLQPSEFHPLDIVNRLRGCFQPTHGFPTNFGPHLGYLEMTQQWRHFFCCAPDGSWEKMRSPGPYDFCWTPEQRTNVPHSKKRGAIFSTGQESSNALMFWENMFVFGGFLYILHVCSMQKKSCVHPHLCCCLEFRWDFQHGIPWEGSHLLCFWSMCFRKWPPQKKKKDLPQPTPSQPPTPKKSPPGPCSVGWVNGNQSPTGLHLRSYSPIQQDTKERNFPSFITLPWNEQRIFPFTLENDWKDENLRIYRDFREIHSQN